MQVPCEVDITGYSAMISVRSERIYSIQSALKCARRELKLYIFTEVYDVTLRVWRRWAAQIQEWMFQNKVNFSGFPCSGSREQWTLCREHVNRNTVHAWSALLTSWLSESGVLTKRDMRGGGGSRIPRTGIENLCSKPTFLFRWHHLGHADYYTKTN